MTFLATIGNPQPLPIKQKPHGNNVLATLWVANRSDRHFEKMSLYHVGGERVAIVTLTPVPNIVVPHIRD